MVAAGGIVSTALAAMINTLLGVELGATGYGRYAFVIATAALIGAVGRFGLGSILIRDIARSVDREKASLGTREPILTALAITAGLTLLLALLTISPIGLSVMESWGGITASGVAALTLLFVAQSIYIINTDALRGLHRLASASILGLPVQRIVALGLITWFVYVAGDDLTPTTAMWFSASAAVVALAVSGTYLGYRIRDLPGARPNRRRARQMAGAGAPLLVTNVIGVAAGRLPIWVFALLGAFDAAGVYALATAFVGLVLLSHRTALKTLAPFVATSYHEGLHKELQKKIRIAAAATALLALALGAILIVVGTVAVPAIFGSDFEDTVVVAAVLLLGTSAMVLGGHAGLLLNVSGNQRWTALSSLISVGLAAIVIFPAAHFGGAIGAAAATAAATVLRVGLTVTFARRQTGIITIADFPALFRSLGRGRFPRIRGRRS